MFKKIAEKLFGGNSAGRPSNGFFLDVRCSQCGEDFHLFVNRDTDLAQDFDEDGNTTYFLKKEIIGSKCRNRIRVHMTFNGRKSLVGKEIEKGEFTD